MTVKITHAQAALLNKVRRDGSYASEIGSYDDRTMDALIRKGYIRKETQGGPTKFVRLK